MSGCVQYIDRHVTKLEHVTTPYTLERHGSLRVREQDIFAAGRCCESLPGGHMVGVNMGVDDIADSHPCLLRREQIRSDLADRIDDRAGSLAAAAEQVGNCHGIRVEE